METFRIIFISLSGLLLVPSIYFFVKKIMLKNQSKMSENDFAMIDQMIDNLIILVAEIIFSLLVISLNIIGTLNIVYN